MKKSENQAYQNAAVIKFKAIIETFGLEVAMDHATESVERLNDSADLNNLAKLKVYMEMKSLLQMLWRQKKSDAEAATKIVTWFKKWN